MLKETLDIYTARELFSFDNKVYSIQIFGNFNGNFAVDVRNRLSSSLANYDHKLIVQEYGSLCLYFHYDDRNEIIPIFNSMVEKFSIYDTMMEYIKNDEHKHAIKNSTRYYPTSINELKTYNKEVENFLKYKYVSSFYHYEFDLIKTIEIIKKSGFNEKNKSDRTYTISQKRNGDDYHTSAYIYIFVNNAAMLFPLKCVYKELKIKEIKFFEYDGVVPLLSCKK